MALEDEIKKAEAEEMQSQEKYGMMAMDAERMGLMNMAGMMREVAGDEGRHAALMRQMMSGMMGRAMRESGSIYVFDGWTYATVGRTQMRGRRTDVGIEFEQVSSSYDQLDIDTVTKRITEALGERESSSRPFPKTYGDWVDLAMSIKEKDTTLGNAAWVNMALQHISDEDTDAEDSKRWLVDKAKEVGVT